VYAIVNARGCLNILSYEDANVSEDTVVPIFTLPTQRRGQGDKWQISTRLDGSITKGPVILIFTAKVGLRAV
jgi:hypothetical protein